MTLDNNFNPKLAIQAQEDYCERNECPMFAPGNGLCPRCGRNIYEPHRFRDHNTVYGIAVNQAGSTLITGCPHCNYSFVE